MCAKIIIKDQKAQISVSRILINGGWYHKITEVLNNQIVYKNILSFFLGVTIPDISPFRTLKKSYLP